MKRLLTGLLLAASLCATALPAGAVTTYSAGAPTPFHLTASSPTPCTSLEVQPGGMLEQFTNNGPLLTVYITFFDEGAVPTCSLADEFWGDGTSQTVDIGQTVTLNRPLKFGLAYTLSGTIPSTNYIDGVMR